VIFFNLKRDECAPEGDTLVMNSREHLQFSA